MRAAELAARHGFVQPLLTNQGESSSLERASSRVQMQSFSQGGEERSDDRALGGGVGGAVAEGSRGSRGSFSSSAAEWRPCQGDFREQDRLQEEAWESNGLWPEGPVRNGCSLLC